MKLFGNTHHSSREGNDAGKFGRKRRGEPEEFVLEDELFDGGLDGEEYSLYTDADEEPQDTDVREDAEEELSGEDEDDDSEDEDDDNEDDDSEDEDFDDDDDDDYDDGGYEDDDSDFYEKGKPVKKRLSMPKKVLIIGLSCLAVVLVGCGLFVNYLLGLINYQKANSDFFIRASTEEELLAEQAVDSELEAIDQKDQSLLYVATESDVEQWNDELDKVTTDTETYEVPISEDIYNILLVGSDARDLSEAARSDAMILVSINQYTKTIYLTSFLRDCYVSIPGYGNTRLNHAFAYGGPALLMETLESNFKVHVDKYMAVNFYSFMDVIDILGGVWINITEEEREVTNKYIWSMNQLLELDGIDGFLWADGWHLMTGKQALAYARNRYTGDDYARAERQRTVISQIMNGALSASPATLVDLAVAVLPQITTDMEKTEVLSYAANALAYLDYEIVSQQVPVAGSYSGATISGMSVIKLDLDDNIYFLQNTIYGTEPTFSSDKETEDDDSGDEEDAYTDEDDIPTPTPAAKAQASAQPKVSATPKPSAAAKSSTSAKPEASAKPSANIAPPVAS